MVDGMGRCMGRGNPLRLPCPHCDPFADDDNGWVGAIPRGCPVAVPALLWERQGDQSDAMNRVPTGCPATGSPVDNASGVDNGWVGAIPRGCPASDGNITKEESASLNIILSCLIYEVAKRL